MTTSTADQADFVIITALEKEAQAVVSRLEDHTVERFQARDIRTYHCGTVPITGTDRAYHVAVVLLPSMGELPAANATTDALNFWNPNFVLMVGIAGGIAQDDLDLGDVVVADQVVGYEYGKVKGNRIMPRDRVYPASALLLDRVRNFWDDAWAEQIKAARPTPAGRDKSKRFVGPIASGNKVIASKNFQTQLKERWPKLIAVETEAEGVFAAVFDRPQIRGTLVIRGISDMADRAKDDAWQEYAANAAAAYTIAWLKTGPVETFAKRATSLPRGPVKISLAKLPSTSPDLFGREKELAALDAAWANPQANVLSLVAWGGVGKTALVNKWLEHLAAGNFRGARRVYGWSLYSQGTGERVTSADLFISEALTWFGDPDPTQGSPWDKGQRLANLVRRDKTLLILDGLEPLQSYLDYERGKLKDPALAILVAELARQNQGLCVITTREAVADLASFPETTCQQDLEQISAEAGRALLRVGGVQGADAELEQAARDFGLHALALNLLASFVHEFPGHHISNAAKIPDLDVPAAQGKHPRRVMAAFATRFGKGPEVELLRILGLFDRPADGGAIAALRAAPAILNLTEHVQGLSEARWLQLVNKLRRVRLIALESKHHPDTLDAHPLVREHFGQQLAHEYPQAWREAHSRLYEYYKSSTKELPDTIEEMAPLYAAVTHGCQAGRHQEAYGEVYRRRIHRVNEFFQLKKLGVFGADLAILSGFFDPPWRQPVATLREDFKGFVLNQAGADLRALGRLAEAAQPMQASLEAYITQKNWESAAITASNLTELELTIGDVTQALAYAKQSVELADRSGDAIQRKDRRAGFAAVLHQAGLLSEAETAFYEAEEIQKKIWKPQYQVLHSVVGYFYCNLLLDQGKLQEVMRRAEQTLCYQSESWYSLLDIALDNLSLGRAHLMQAREETFRVLETLKVSLRTLIARWTACGRRERNICCHSACSHAWNFIVSLARWTRRGGIWMKRSPSPRAAGWGCIWRIAIWNMRGGIWQWRRLVETFRRNVSTMMRVNISPSPKR
jgi:nucleoside phosphorylase/tetratricopeptide (TPR) repeat protein